jgi:CO dehydrogenase/acetyl-CoA synthase delta subunit
MGALPKVKYGGKIREVKIGKPGTEIVLGGETAYSFYSFEGTMPHPPKLALQVLDTEPEEWAAEALEQFKDVIRDPVAWARRCVDDFAADVVCLWLAGTDPNGKNLPAEHAAETARKVAEAIDAPLIVWGVSNDEKNTAVLKAVAEACAGLNLVLGPVTEANYKQVGAAAIAYKHVIAANSPIDINLAKQLNILLENLGVPSDRILIDPTTGSVGYGLEYCYSIMERIRQAALTQNDDKLQSPIINNIAEEVWKTKEAKLLEDDDPKLGNAGIRGVNLEAITALSALQAGSDLLILRHPKTLQHLRKYVSDMMVPTDLEAMGVDLSLAATPEAAATAAKQERKTEAGAPRVAAAEAPVSTPEPSLPVSSQAEAIIPAPEVREAGEAARLAEPAVTRSAAQTSASASDNVELSDEDLAALREMLGAFRAVKNLFEGLAKLVGGG